MLNPFYIPGINPIDYFPNTLLDFCELLLSDFAYMLTMKWAYINLPLFNSLYQVWELRLYLLDEICLMKDCICLMK